MGWQAEAVVELSIFLMCLGALTAIMYFIGTMSASFLATFSVTIPAALCSGFIGATVLLPLGLLKNISALSPTSLLSLVAVLWMTVLLAVHKMPSLCAHGAEPSVELCRWSTSLLATVPTIALAYCNHPNFLAVVQEMHLPTQSRCNVLITGSTIVTLLWYVVVCALGYLALGTSPPANILEALPNTALYSSCSVGMLLCIILSYPLILFPCRACLDASIRRVQEHWGLWPPVRLVFISEVVLVLGLSWLIASVAPSALTIFAFTGTITASVIIYIAPAAFYIRLYHMQADGKKGKLQDGWYCISVLLIVFGVVLLFVGTVVN